MIRWSVVHDEIEVDLAPVEVLMQRLKRLSAKTSRGASSRQRRSNETRRRQLVLRLTRQTFRWYSKLDRIITEYQPLLQAPPARFPQPQVQFTADVPLLPHWPDERDARISTESGQMWRAWRTPLSGRIQTATPNENKPW